MAGPGKPVLPMQPGGGIFLMLVGVGMAIGSTLGAMGRGYGVMAGLAAGLAAIPIAVKLARGRFGRPTRAHNIALWAAIAFEVAAFVGLGRYGYFTGSQGTALALATVAVHFIIMRWSHGPLILRMALALLAWIALCAVLQFPIPVLFAGDGIIKILFGALMAAPLFPQLQEPIRVSDA